MSGRTFIAHLGLLFWTCLLCGAEPLAFLLEFRRSGERVVKVSVVTDDKGESAIRVLVIDTPSREGSSTAVRDRQRVLAPDEIKALASLVDAVQPPLPKKEVIAEGSVWVFKRGDEEAWLYRSPTFKPKERQVDQIRALGEYVWRIEGLRADAGRCF